MMKQLTKFTLFGFLLVLSGCDLNEQHYTKSFPIPEHQKPLFKSEFARVIDGVVEVDSSHYTTLAMGPNYVAVHVKADIIDGQRKTILVDERTGFKSPIRACSFPMSFLLSDDAESVTVKAQERVISWFSNPSRNPGNQSFMDCVYKNMERLERSYQMYLNSKKELKGWRPVAPDDNLS